MDRSSYFRRNNLRFLVGLAVVIFILILLVSVAVNSSNDPKQISINDQNFRVELAETDIEKQIGLSETESLDNDEGMLFVFENPDFYSFWMKNMKFPIDIIYINGNKVTTIIRNATPPSKDNADLTVYRPKEKSDKVLEINAGLAKEYNIEEGSIIDTNNL